MYGKAKRFPKYFSLLHYMRALTLFAPFQSEFSPRHSLPLEGKVACKARRMRYPRFRSAKTYSIFALQKYIAILPHKIISRFALQSISLFAYGENSLFPNQHSHCRIKHVCSVHFTIPFFATAQIFFRIPCLHGIEIGRIGQEDELSFIQLFRQSVSRDDRIRRRRALIRQRTHGLPIFHLIRL